MCEGDEEILTVRQVVEICAAELDHQWEIVSMPADLAVPARPLMMQPSTHHRAFDISALRHTLGYRDDVVPAGRSPEPLDGWPTIRTRPATSSNASWRTRSTTPTRTGSSRGGSA
ncbi:MAG: hypothetical protein R2695_02585 [Acidimicrobiales bacterium]